MRTFTVDRLAAFLEGLEAPPASSPRFVEGWRWMRRHLAMRVSRGQLCSPPDVDRFFDVVAPGLRKHLVPLAAGALACASEYALEVERASVDVHTGQGAVC